MRSVFAHDKFVVIREGAAAPEVSFLMPLYQQARFVGEAVRSVLRQVEVTAELLLSDDASTDGTLERALETVAATPTPHRVVVRRGSRRLWRDHLSLLVDHASHDIVIQAHGDDVAEPRRGRIVTEVMRETGALLLGSTAATIDERGAIIAPPATDHQAVRLMKVEDVLRYPTELTGARLAWRREALGVFGCLDSRAAAVCHDRVLPFRAALAGAVVVVNTPLLQRREHPNRASTALVDRRRREAEAFGIALQRLSMLRGLRGDLAHACALGMVSGDGRVQIGTLLDAQEQHWTAQLLDNHDALARAGRVPLWVDDHELRLAWRGELSAWLRYQTNRWPRLKRMLAAVREVGTRARRLKSSGEARW